MARHAKLGDRTDITPRMVVFFAGGTLLLSTLILLISAGLAAAPAYRISGTIIGSPQDADTLTRCQAIARASDHARTDGRWTSQVDLKQGTFTLSLEAENPTAGVAAVDRVARDIVDRVNSQLASRPAIDPAVAAENARLRRLIDDCDRQLAAASQPAASQPHRVADLLVALQQTLTERQKNAARLKEIAVQLKQPPPTADQVTLTTMPATLPSHEGAQALRRLEADTTAFNQRQGRLAELLRELLDTSMERLEIAKSAVDEKAGGLGGAVPADSDPDVRKQLQTIREALQAWTTTTGELADAWRSKKEDLEAAGPAFDAPVCQAALEMAAKDFLQEGDKARARIQVALTTIKEGGDEPTKRIILHRNLSQQIQPALEAMDKAQAAARLVQQNENAQLAATVKMVASLRDRVSSQRGEIQSQLREHALQDLRAKHEEQLGGLRLRHEENQLRASELETAMIGGIAEIVGLLAVQESQRQSSSRVLQLQRQRGTLLEQLLKLKERPAPEHPTPLRCQAAHVTAIITPPGPGLSQTLRVGIGPMIISFMAVGGIWWLFRWRRAQGTLDDLARELKMASQRGKE
ncbi:MAG: hypothetical protein KA354_03280 [Phycisphaerae bacterium]|nr:hypothetical protein [Phycisphaerae bacterium]